MSNTFVALDVETANEDYSSICSIGLVKFVDGLPTETMYSLINPETYFNSYNISMHGISEQMVKDAPTFPEISLKLNDFIDNLPVVAHYSQFDMGALKKVHEKYHLDLPSFQYFCSYLLTKALVKDKINYKLNTLCKIFDIPLDHHNALSDAKAAGQIILHLMELNKTHSITDLLTKGGYKRFGKIGFNGFRKSQKYRPDAEFYKELAELLTEEDILSLDTNHPFYGKHFVFTGTLDSVTQDEAALLVTKKGAIPQKRVTLKTNYLVIGVQDLRVVGQSGQSGKMKKHKTIAIRDKILRF